jgi:tRNA A37 N6-isopentenylltransferase MiaA
MMARGLLDEVKRLLDMGISEKHTAMQAIGYKELTAALRRVHRSGGGGGVKRGSAAMQSGS